MARKARIKNPYRAAPKQSEIPDGVTDRAVWYLNTLGSDLAAYNSYEWKEFHGIWDAFNSVNLPIMCKTRKLGKHWIGECRKYPPLSGLAGRRRKGKTRRR